MSVESPKKASKTFTWSKETEIFYQEIEKFSHRFPLENVQLFSNKDILRSLVDQIKGKFSKKP